MGNIIITDGAEIYQILFNDIEADIRSFPYNGFKEGMNFDWMFYRITHSAKLRFPFLRLWNRFVVRKFRVKKGDTVLLLSNAVWSYIWNGGIIDALKIKKCKIILLMVDARYVFDYEEIRKNNINDAVSRIDRIYTFDKNDALRYSWKHTFQYYSKLQYIEPIGAKTDVFCAIWDGGRIETVVKIYDYFKDCGLKCSFYIMGYKEDLHKDCFREGIVYNQYISYREILGRTIQANVILEPVKEKQRGSTLRYYEAVVYNKKLLTSNRDAKELPFYDARFVKQYTVLEDIKQIDLTFFTSDTDVNYKYKDEFSPVHLFKEINR